MFRVPVVALLASLCLSGSTEHRRQVSKQDPQQDPARKAQLPDEPIYLITESGRLRTAFGAEYIVEAGAHVVPVLGVHEPRIWVRSLASGRGRGMRITDAETMAAVLEEAAETEDQEFVNGVAGMLVELEHDGSIRFELVQRDGMMPGVIEILTDASARSLAELIRKAVGHARWVGQRLKSLAPERSEIERR